VAAAGLRRISAVASNTFRESIRERVLYNLVLFAVLMTLSGLLLGKLSIYQDEKIIKDIGLASMEIFGTLIATFLGVGLVSKEIERRSLYPLLARPIKRSEFLLGKFFGLSLTIVVNAAAMAAGLYATLAATQRALDPRLLAAMYLIVLGLVLSVSLTLLLSATTSSTVTAAICALALLASGRYSDVIRGMRQIAPDVPRWLTEGLYFALPNFGNFDIKDAMVYGDPVPWAFMGWATLYAIGYCGVVLSIAVRIFARREMQ
jgi:ABC-type transport system involved in multi-copper enzyme maturation permease subunit